ncbi:MAG: SDR family oxidoreductase [Solimonas sp.]
MSHIVVVGGTSGIGLASAKRMAARGDAVTIVGRDAARLQAAVREVGPQARGEALDASDAEALRAFHARLGRFDHLVLSASGGAGAGPFAQVEAAALQRGFDAKFWVHWHAAQAALPFLAPDGSMTFITAASSRLANPGTAGLAAINGAIERMVRTLARELAPLRVNAVSPGVIATPWWDDKPKALFASASERSPLQRAGEAAEVADGVAFLIGNRFVTGVILDIDGGLHLT